VALKDAVERFRAAFEMSDGSLLVPEERAEAISPEDVEAERLRKYPIPAQPPLEKE
jgi:hypothetical protein